jgi:AcrR family transcriptional regulator
MNERSFIEGNVLATLETDSTYQKIIQAAHDLFVAQGYHGTSMRAVAAQAEIALGGIYNHFDSKENLFVAVLEAYHPYHQMVPVLQEAEGETVEAYVENAARAFVDLLQDRPNFLNLMFIEVVEFENRHIPHLVDQFAPHVLGIVASFAQHQSDLRNIPLPIIVRAFLGFFYSYIMIETMLGESLMPELRQNALKHTIDIFLHGIAEV